MMEYDLYNDLVRKTELLDDAIRRLRVAGGEYATAEREYKILLRVECLKLREEGMAIGLMTMVCKGIPSVAQARFNRDMAEIEYKATQDEINSIKLQMRLLESQIQREWSQS